MKVSVEERLVPVMLTKVEIPFGYRKIHAANLSDWKPGTTNPSFDQLIKAVSTVLGQELSAIAKTDVRRKLTLRALIAVFLIFVLGLVAYWEIKFRPKES